MRILVCSPTFLPTIGGAELGIHEIYQRLGQQHDVTVLTPARVSAHPSESSIEPPRYKIRYYGKRFHRLGGVGRKLETFAGLAYKEALSSELSQNTPDLVNVHFIRPQLATTLRLTRGRRNPPPVALSMVARGDVLALLGQRKRRVATSLVAQCNLVLPNSGYYLKGVVPSNNMRVRVIPYGVDSNRYRPSAVGERELDAAWLAECFGFSEESVVCLSVQRLTRVKRVDILLRAFALASQTDQRLRLIVAGTGPEIHSLRKMRDDLRLQGRVVFPGYIPEQDLPRIFRAAHIFTFPSPDETFGVVFAQAMASGLPIVAVRSSCIPEVVEAGINGLLADSNSPESMSEEILRLASSKPRCLAIGAANRTKAVEHFDWDRIALDYANEFSGMTAEVGG